ncbi:hypothetical protein [Pleomorphomonas carboxyditropha]|uniref:DUF4376 domain-containing protein n=2 Tax=Pleomorphomonas TaxID=261933 RepID=A0A2G9WV39_9HYPH|nr:hypothetical protein [Pleomorphomonas carboxyditropha]PIO98575.1 hypothetical protein CJ014_14755 [Pleomorphomonas carboxyditropha]
MATKTVYQRDADGVYAGAACAYESPLEPGVFHIPAGCVEIEPPAVVAGKVAVWSGDAWMLMADHRGEIWYLNGEAVTIDFVGDPMERDYNATRPSSPINLENLRAAVKASVDAAAEAYRLTYITGGSGQAMAYQQKLEEAKAYLADPSLTAAECPHIFAEIGITGETADAVAQVVVAMHAAWQIKSAEIEHKRLAAKAAIDAAETIAAINLMAKMDWDA